MSPDPSPVADDGRSLSETLKAAREAAGLEFDSLAKQTRIARGMLEALEAGRYQELPGDPYVRAFLGTLARQYKLDVHLLLAQYSRDTGKGAEITPPVPRIHDTEKFPARQKKTPIVVILSVLALALWGLFQWRSQVKEEAAEAGSQAGSPLPAGTDSILDTLDPGLREALALETTSVSDSLTAAAAVRPDSLPLASQVKDSLRSRPEPVQKTSKSDTFVIRCIADTSVWVGAQKRRLPDANRTLRRDSAWTIIHSDTLWIKTGIPKSMEVRTSKGVFHPSDRKFRLLHGRVLD